MNQNQQKLRMLEGNSVIRRIAKITPTKLGLFVTLWKRPVPGGVIMPFDSTDDIDFIVVNVAEKNDAGQFIFDRKTLIAQGVMSTNGKGGKRALRVYPPWTKPQNKQALKTQEWQLEHFFAST